MLTKLTMISAEVELDIIQKVKTRMSLANSKYKTINLKDRLENHKAMIAAYFSNPGDLILDVGGHHGSYALFYQQLVGPKGKVITYEASPYIFAYLKKRLLDFNVTNVLAKEKAVSSTINEKLMMKVYQDIGPACCTVEPVLMYEGRMPGKTEMVEVETETLDELITTEYSPVKFIKIDVEGHESAVFEGAKQLLLTQRPIVIFELGAIIGRFEPQTIKQMEDLDYVCFDLRYDDKRVYPGYMPPLSDILALPIEQAEEVLQILPYLYY